MTKSEIANDIRKETGTAFPNMHQLTIYFKMDSRTIEKFLECLDTWDHGRQQKYFIGDIADRIIANRKRG